MSAAMLAVGLVLSLGSPALAAPIGALKQFKVPTADSQPRAIANGSDGNRWFTEGKAVKGSEPFGITVAPDGDPWYTMMAASKVATLQLR